MRAWLAITLLCAGCGEGGSRPGPPDLGAPSDFAVAADLRAQGPAVSCAPIGPPKLLSNLPGSHAYPRLGWTGNHFVVAWNTEVVQASQVKNRIDVTITDESGNKLGPNLPMSRTPLADFWAASVTPLVDATVIAWTRVDPQTGTKEDIVIDLLDASGQKLDANGNACAPDSDTCGIFPVTSSGTASYPYLSRPQVDTHTAGPSDNQVALTFVDSRNYPCPPGPPCVNANDVYWKKLQSNGKILVDDKLVTTPASNGHNAFPRLAFDGVHDGIVWRDDASINTQFWFATLDGNGAVSSAPMKIGSASGSYVSAGAPDLVWTGSEYALATATGSDVSASVVFQRFQSNGVANQTPIGVTFDGVACTPAIAWDGEHYAVAWQTNCGQSPSQLAFELIDGDGIRQKPDGTTCAGNLDPKCGVMLLTSYPTATAAFPQMVWAGGHAFGIAWMATDDDADSGTRQSQVWFNRVVCTSP